MSSYILVTHTDMDGVGSAAIYTYLQGKPPAAIYFSEPYTLDRVLGRIKSKTIRGRRLAVMDLGMNPRIIDKIIEEIRRLSREAAGIEWYDHHVWDGEWVERLKGIGVRVNVDRSTCAAGVVARYAPRGRNMIDESFLEEIVRGVCAGDLWRFDHWRGPWYLRLVRRRDSVKWRLHVLKVISSGRAWSQEFTDKIVERVEVELMEYRVVDEYILSKTVDGIRIAVAPNSKLVDNSFVAAYVMGRTDADIVGIIGRGGKLSLRSRSYNIRDLAVKLGGGGHPRAAGALVKIPLIVRIKSLFNKSILLEYVLNAIASNIDSVSRLEE